MTDDEIALKAKELHPYYEDMTENQGKKIASKRRNFIEGAVWCREETLRRFNKASKENMSDAERECYE